MTLNSIFLAFLLISRCISACPSHKHLNLNLPETKSLLPPNLLFLLYFLFQRMTAISTQSLKPKFWEPFSALLLSSLRIWSPNLLVLQIFYKSTRCFHISALCAALLVCFSLVFLENSFQLLSLSSNTAFL